MIDLHCHSTFSDGTYTPKELVAMARDAKLTALALTDHDSTRGIVDFLATNDEYGDDSLTCIPGIEISSDVPKGTLHMLGYYVDHTDKGLDEQLLPIRDSREYRNKQILRKINDLGLELTWEEVLSVAGDDVVGRPHFAMAMIDKGFVKGKQQAFDQYLAKGKPAYADRFRLQPEKSIEMINSSGGVAVLAHPYTLELGKAALREYVGQLSDMGLEGIEIFYPMHADHLCKQYLSLAKEFNLLVTGGSDFHGAANPSIRLGRGFGTLHVPDELFDKLKERVGR